MQCSDVFYSLQKSYITYGAVSRSLDFGCMVKFIIKFRIFIAISHQNDSLDDVLTLHKSLLRKGGGGKADGGLKKIMAKIYIFYKFNLFSVSSKIAEQTPSKSLLISEFVNRITLIPKVSKKSVLLVSYKSAFSSKC